MSETREGLAMHLKELCGECFSFSPQLLVDDLPLKRLNVDSLHLLEFAVAVEQSFAVEINERELARCSTVGEAVQLLTERISAGQITAEGEQT